MMSTDIASRNYLKELIPLVDKYVAVETKTDETSFGILKGIHPETMMIVLKDAKRKSDGRQFPRVIIHGNTIAIIYLEEEPFDLEGLKAELEKAFPQPGSIKYYPEAETITILDRVKVTEQGVEGTGLIADRVRQIWQRYVEELKKKKEREKKV